MIVPFKSQLRGWWHANFPGPTQHCVSVDVTWTPRQLAIAWAILLAAALLVMLPNLSYPLIEPDETRYAQIALEMIDSRDWVTPTLDGQAYLDKPPLMYWLTAISFELLGRNEFAARIPSMLSAVGTVVMIFFLGSRIVSRRAAWLGAMSLTLCGGFVLAGRFLILDGLLACCTTLCMLSGYIAVRGERHRWAWWMLSGVACSLGVLTKGPVALVLCSVPLVVSGWLRADHSRTRILHWIAFVVPMFVVCLPWYIAVARFNPQFLDYFFWEHNLKRFTQGSNHEQPFWFYVPVMLAAMFPASLLLPASCVFLLSRSNRKRTLRSKDLGFLFCGAAWMLLFFSLSSCKLPTYILPAIPLICLMIGVMLDQTVFRGDFDNRITAFLRPFPQRAGMTLLVAWVAIIGAEIWITREVSVGVVGLSVLCLTVAFVTYRLWGSELAFGAFGWAGSTVLALVIVAHASTRFVPIVSYNRSVYVKTQQMAQDHPDAPIVFFGDKPHAAQLNLPVSRMTYLPYDRKEAFAALMTRHDSVIVVTCDKQIESTRAAVADSHELILSEGERHLYLGLPVKTPDQRVALVDAEKTTQ